MKFFVVIALVCVALTQAEIDWVTIKPNHIHHVKPTRPAPTPKIIGGQETEPHGIPFQVAVVSGGFCGGSLIRSDVVLTAAHCVDGLKQTTVIAGAHKIQEEEPDQQTVDSKKIIVHEQWDSWTVRNDIALVILASEIKLGSTASLVDLNEEKSSLEGEEAIVSGWGKQSDSTGPIISPVLRYVVSDIISNRECKFYFSSYIQPTNVCLDGSTGKSSCGGDSGGPLCIKRNDKPVQVGIVSFGNGEGCETGYPSVYTRVSSFIDWIKKNLP